MKLILMRHGDALDGGRDDMRPLSAEGVGEAERAAEALARIREAPGLICHSELLRARQTALIVAKRLGLTQNMRETLGLRPGDSAGRFAREVESGAHCSGDVMVVGHLPFMAELASCLLAGSESAVSVRFTTATLLCLERVGRGLWTQRYHLPAKLIARVFGALGTCDEA